MNSAIDERKIFRAVEQAVARHGSSCEALVPILSDVNREFGFIPLEAIPEIRRTIHKPAEGQFLGDSHIFSVASFYQMFSLRQLGRHIIRFCASAPCHVMGGNPVLQAVRKKLGIDFGGTTADGKWSLLQTSCLGICAVGPVCLIDGTAYGNLTPEKIRRILEAYD